MHLSYECAFSDVALDDPEATVKAVDDLRLAIRQYMSTNLSMVAEVDDRDFFIIPGELHFVPYLLSVILSVYLICTDLWFI